MKIASIEVGFVDVPECTSMNVFCVGCSLCCPECHNPQLQDPCSPLGHDFTIAVLTQKIKAAEGLVDTVCWMGGEPLDQCEELYAAIQKCRQHCPEIRHAVYTGRTREELLRDPLRYKVFEIADAVKTGRWNGNPIGEENSGQQWWVDGETVDNRELHKRLSGDQEC